MPELTNNDICAISGVARVPAVGFSFVASDLDMAWGGSIATYLMLRDLKSAGRCAPRNGHARVYPSSACERHIQSDVRSSASRSSKLRVVRATKLRRVRAHHGTRRVAAAGGRIVAS